MVACLFCEINIEFGNNIVLLSFKFLTLTADFGNSMPKKNINKGCAIDRTFSSNAVKRKNLNTKNNEKTESFQKIADDSNLNVMLVRRLVGGGQAPKLSEAYAIAAALGTSLNNLSGGKEQEAIQRVIKAFDEVYAERDVLKQTLIEVYAKIEGLDERSKAIWYSFVKTIS